MSAERRSFVDTNVLVYAHDETAGTKRDTAHVIVGQLWESGRGCVSVQVLQELYVTLTQKLPRPVDRPVAMGIVEDFAQWTVHAPEADDVLGAIRFHRRHRISFWDALIVQSALQLGCDVLYTEDLNAGQHYDGVRVVNPFS